MDWVFWGAVSFTICVFGASIYIINSIFSAERREGLSFEAFCAIRAGWWLAWAMVFAFPSGLYIAFYGAFEGGSAPFAATLPDAQVYWTQLLPSSIRFAIREQFQEYYPVSLHVLTGLAFISLTLSFYRLIWQPVIWSRGHNRSVIETIANRYYLFFIAKAIIWTLVVATIHIFSLQTFFFLLGHAVATLFFILPILFVLAVLGAASGGGTAVYDRNGRYIGRIDR